MPSPQSYTWETLAFLCVLSSVKNIDRRWILREVVTRMMQFLPGNQK